MLKQINQVVSKQLKFIVQCLKAQKILYIAKNIAKLEFVIFRRKKKQLDCDLDLKLCGEDLKPLNYLRYLGIYVDEYINWSYHIDNLSQKFINL